MLNGPPQSPFFVPINRPIDTYTHLHMLDTHTPKVLLRQSRWHTESNRSYASSLCFALKLQVPIGLLLTDV
jgi:hypothetical protein